MIKGIKFASVPVANQDRVFEDADGNQFLLATP